MPIAAVLVIEWPLVGYRRGIINRDNVMITQDKYPQQKAMLF